MEKRDGTIREQIHLEDKVRREYERKWGQLTHGNVNEFYNPNYLSKEFRKRWKKDVEKCPYVYDIQSGEARFISKGIYDKLWTKCRCGRPRTEGHLVNCLQKATTKTTDGHERCNQETPESASISRSRTPLPVTSSGVIGWPKHKYQDLERSTYYTSPKYSTPGGRIDDKPYSNIFIG